MKRGWAFTALGFVLVLVVAVTALSPATAARPMSAAERADQHAGQASNVTHGDHPTAAAGDMNAVLNATPYTSSYATPTVDYNATAESAPADVAEPVSKQLVANDLESRVVALETRVAALEGTRAPTPTPQPTSTPAPTIAPTASPTLSHGVNPCGVPLDQWWPAVEANGCRNQSERGDAPPTWVKTYEQSRGRTFSMHGPNLTGPAESAMKYMVMKGYAFSVVVKCARMNFSTNACADPRPPRTIDIYCVIHGGSVPFERAGVVHSWRCWFKEQDTQKISAIQGWYQAPGFGFERVCGFDSTPARNNFPIIFGPSRATWGKGCGDAEQWYVRAFGNNPNIEFGITFVNAVALLQPNEKPTDYDVSKWDLSGSSGTTRRLEISYYRGVTRNNNNLSGIYTADQFGEVMTGSNDPRCGQPVQRLGNTYTRLCLEQNVSISLPEISFATTVGGNAFQRTYDSRGVGAPN